MSKAYYRILAILFVIIFGGVFIANIVVKDKDFSELENRVLAKKPEFTVNSFVEGRYANKVDDYVNDQFIFRSNFVTLKSSVDKFLGKVENNGVYLGKDDQLFEKPLLPNEKMVNGNLKAINDFAEKYKDKNIVFNLVPNSDVVLKDKLPSNAPTVDTLKYINEFGKSLDKNIKFVNPYNELEDHKDEYIYYKTDHHWTTLGAYYGYKAMCKDFDLEPVSLKDYNKTLVSDSFYGTLFSKALFKRDNGDDINLYIPKDKDDQVVVQYVNEKKNSASMYDSEYLTKKDKYATFLGGNHPVVNIKTTAKLKEERKLLILKDSYANSLVPFLTTQFTEITLVDPRYYYDDLNELIKQEGYTDILFLYNANTFFQDNSLSSAIQ